MKPFRDNNLGKVLDNQLSAMKKKIESFSNEEIMANDSEIMIANLFEEYRVFPLEIYGEIFEKRNVIQQKIKRPADWFLTDYYQDRYVNVDGFKLSFSYSFSGDRDLFKCQASTYSLSGYPEIELSSDSFTICIERTVNEMHEEQAKLNIDKERDEKLKRIIDGVRYVNNDVESFNAKLREIISDEFQKRKRIVESFYEVSQMFEVPIEKTEYSKTHVPLQRKISPISHNYETENSYVITDTNYLDVLSTIKHIASTFERTPASYSKLQEEELRDIILAGLNGTYKGGAFGEAFRNAGKTDICIEAQNRAAFVAECKIWKGIKLFSAAIVQLDSYLTWRDCKTALIVFVKQKNFLDVLKTVSKELDTCDAITSVRRHNENEFECAYKSMSNPGQIIKIRILLFNLYSKNSKELS